MRAHRTAPHTLALALIIGALGLGGCLTLPGRHVAAKGPATTVNNPADAQWTSTTWEAVSTPEHRKMLEHARPMTVIGEVVDISCLLQLGKRTWAKLRAFVDLSAKNGEANAAEVLK